MDLGEGLETAALETVLGGNNGLWITMEGAGLDFSHCTTAASANNAGIETVFSRSEAKMLSRRENEAATVLPDNLSGTEPRISSAALGISALYPFIEVTKDMETGAQPSRARIRSQEREA